MAGLLARPQKARIVLNLESVSNIYGSGVGALVRAYTDTRHRGGELKLVCPPGKVLRLLQVTKLITLFQGLGLRRENLEEGDQLGDLE